MTESDKLNGNVMIESNNKLRGTTKGNNESNVRRFN